MIKTYWTSENRLESCDCLSDSPAHEAFSPFKVMRVSDHEKIVADLLWFKDQINAYVIPGISDTQEATSQAFFKLKFDHNLVRETLESQRKINDRAWEKNKKLLKALDRIANEHFECEYETPFDGEEILKEWAREALEENNK